jgi:hypothetical protein
LKKGSRKENVGRRKKMREEGEAEREEKLNKGYEGWRGRRNDAEQGHNKT